MGKRSVSRYGFIGYIGLAFWQLWWMLAMRANVVISERDLAVLHQSFAIIRPFTDSHFWLTVFTTFGYATVAIISVLRKAQYTTNRSNYYRAAVLATGGTFFGRASTYLAESPFYLPVLIASLLSIGTGIALIIVMWGERFSTLQTARVGRYLYASFAIAFSIYFLTMLLPETIHFAVACAAPIVSMTLLRICGEAPRRKPPKTAYQGIRAIAPKAVTSIFVVGCIHGVVQTSLGEVLAFTRDEINWSLLVDWAMLMVMFLGIVVAKPQFETLTLQRAVIPSLAIGLIILSLADDKYSFIGNGLCMFGIHSLDMLLLLVASDLVYRFNVPIALLLGLTMFTERVGTTIGTALYWQAFGASEWGMEEMSLLLLLFAAVVIVIGTLFFTELDFMKLYQPLPTLPSKTLDVPSNCITVAQEHSLTPRESEILRLLSEGRSGPYIAKELVISENTVRNHISNIYRKIGVYDRQSLIDVILAVSPKARE